MELKKLFKRIESMDADTAAKYMLEHPEGSYTILDVRQPFEYEEEHIPGAKLIPLPALTDSVGALDPETPIIVHCAIGGRSRVAAQALSVMGFKKVYNLSGGIKAWKGVKAVGPVELNLDLVRGDETRNEILDLAYWMEKALLDFYARMEGQSKDQSLVSLFALLSEAEERHIQMILELKQDSEAEQGPVADRDTTVMEGGFDAASFIEQNQTYLTSAPDTLELAMMIETQALDLYLRFSNMMVQESTRKILLRIAHEEKNHLANLGHLLEKINNE